MLSKLVWLDAYEDLRGYSDHKLSNRCMAVVALTSFKIAVHEVRQDETHCMFVESLFWLKDADFKASVDWPL